MEVHSALIFQLVEICSCDHDLLKSHHKMQSSCTFCLLRPLSATALEALHVVENRPYVVCLPTFAPVDLRSREETPIIEEESQAFALTFQISEIKDPTLGHVFGSNLVQCDILMDRVRTRGVSGAHFRVQLDYRHRLPDTLFIGNFSRNWTRVAGKILQGPLVHILKSGDTPISIVGGRVNLEINFSSARMHDPQFLKSWEIFNRFALTAVPSIANIR